MSSQPNESPPSPTVPAIDEEKAVDDALVNPKPKPKPARTPRLVSSASNPSPSTAILNGTAGHAVLPVPGSESRSAGTRKLVHYKLFKTPKEATLAVAAAGEIKALSSWDRVLLKGFLAGVLLAFGGQLSITVGGGMPGSDPGLQKLAFGSLFPIGLILIVIVGGELFTGNTMYMATAVLSRKVALKELGRNWGWSYLGNFLGSIFAATFFSYLTDHFEKDPWNTFVHQLAENKTINIGWGTLLLRAIPCNWLVCLSLFCAIAAEDILGKIVAIWFPIFTFVSVGFEHSIANMYFIPVGIFYGADVGFGTFLWKNLLPVTIGNIIGGTLFVATIMWYLYVSESLPRERALHPSGKALQLVPVLLHAHSISKKPDDTQVELRDIKVSA